MGWQWDLLDPKRELKPGGDRIIQELYQPFLEESLASLIKFGFVVGKVVTREDGVKYPYAVPMPLYDARIGVDKGFREKWVVRLKTTLATANDSEDPSVFVFTIPSRYPSPASGKYRSYAAPAVTHAYFNAGLLEKMVVAETQRSHPPVVLERDEKMGNSAKASRDEEFAESIATITSLRRGLYKEAVREVGNAQDEALAGYRGGTPMETVNTHIGNSVKMVYPTYVDNLFMVPDGWKMASTQPTLPEPPSYLTDMLRQSQEHILDMLRLPRVLGVGDKAVSSLAGANKIDDQDLLILARTLRYWQKILLRLADTAYTNVTEREKADVEFTLRLVPVITPSSIFELTNSNTISDELAKSILIDMHMLEPGDKLPEGKENAHKRPLPGRSENTTAPLMAAKRMSILANVEEMKAKAALHRIVAPAEAAERKAHAVALKKVAPAEAEEHKAKAAALKRGDAGEGGSKRRKK